MSKPSSPLSTSASKASRSEVLAAEESVNSLVHENSNGHDIPSSWPKDFFELYGAADDPSFTVPEELSWVTE